MTSFVRGSGGRSIHRFGCQYAKGPNMRPWLWAEGREPGYLAEVAAGFGYRGCRVCDPFDGTVAVVDVDDVDGEEEL